MLRSTKKEGPSVPLRFYLWDILWLKCTVIILMVTAIRNTAF